MTIHRKHLWHTVPLVIAAGLLLIGVPSGADAEEYLLEETKVTATKMGETKLQETPIAITALSEKELKDSGMQSLRDLGMFVPNTEFTHNIGLTQGFIRGIGSPFPGPTAGESSVAYYVDGVYIESGVGLNIDFLDIERIEVLRGPQGTLYGRNANAGAINIITKKPTDKLEIMGSAEMGNYNKRRFDASVSGPVVDDKVKARVTAYTSRHDGLLHNISTGNDPRSQDDSGVRGSVDIAPAESVRLRLAADYWDYRSSGPSYKLVSDRGSLGTTHGAQVAPNFWDVNTDQPGSSVTTNWGGSATLDINLPGSMVLRSITAYRRYETDFSYDSDGSQVNKGFVKGHWPVDQLSEELQLSAIWERWQWVMGLYYYNQKTHSRNPTEVKLDYLLPPGLTFDSQNRVETDTDSYAAFGSARYALTDRVSLEAGLRYSVDKKSMSVDAESRLSFLPAPIPLQQRLSDRWNAVLPRFGVDYRPTDQAMVYASASRGYKPGGFVFFVPQADNFLNPEYIWNYEAGFKTDWLDKKLRVNAAFFYSQYKDLQVFAVVNGVGQQSNAAEATIKGVELELQARPVKALTLNGAVSYLHARYKEYISVVPGSATSEPLDVSGNRLQYAPQWKIALGAQYEFTLGRHGFLTVRSDLAWKDKVYFDQYQRDSMAQDHYTIVNALVRFETPDRRWSAEAYGLNVFGEKYYTSGLATLEPLDIALMQGDPTLFGVRVSFKF